MKPALFAYDAPRTVEEATAILATDPSAMILAGGQSLIPAMNMRLASPARLIDIQRVEGLKGIAIVEGQVRVRAMTRHRELELDAAVYAANPLVRAMMQHVAHIPIRNRGTVVGSLCHADAAAEMPMLLVLTDGCVVAQGRADKREIAARDFFQFHLTTSRRPDEMIVEARFPTLPAGAGWAFEEFTRRHGDYAIAAVGAIVIKNAGRARVALAACGVSSRPIRLEAAEAVLNGSDLSAAKIADAARAAMTAVTTPDDVHASAEYRRRLLAALVRRTVEQAMTRAA
jgi:carbon-monoxide dehydrogenase medium subunit